MDNVFHALGPPECCSCTLFFCADLLRPGIRSVCQHYPYHLYAWRRRYTATILGFFEALIWVIAMRQVFQHLDNWICLFMYRGGFAGGIFVGMIIEERIAYGKVIIAIITTMTSRS